MRTTIGLDRDLILDCRNGDVRAWQRLLDRYERLVFSVPRRYGLSREDAADITQLTFTILFQSMDTLPEESTLGAWLTTVARRDRKSTRLNSSHANISYAVFCLKKKKK